MSVDHILDINIIIINYAKTQSDVNEIIRQFSYFKLNIIVVIVIIIIID